MPPKRQGVSLETKVDLLEYKKQNPAFIHEQLALKISISSRKNVTDILSKKDKYTKSAKEAAEENVNIQRKRIHDTSFPEVLDRIAATHRFPNWPQRHVSSQYSCCAVNVTGFLSASDNMATYRELMKKRFVAKTTT
ncbi:hypothetical protein PsorP6_001584 [Peronosclerospora sorghi]|uniref:Uncharacterized protein n=1 Tax=Peronosclerospora sorghi TaxID=230839 RepID=A0ACC0WP69_9STRA|nr:hypothetical protein PsorP6_001584 [Peronosclerospora sorghi]